MKTPERHQPTTRIFMAVMLTALCCLTSLATPRLSLLTFYPGSEIYELEGHTAIRLQDNSIDIVLNWGTFDFNAPNFVYRFVKGETDYMLAAVYTDMFIDYYRMCGRRVVEQPLALTDDEAERAAALITENLLPQNRVYRYNYVLDNCATRPLALIEKSLHAPLTLAPVVYPERTFREVMRAYHVNYPWYQFGIDLALGMGIDRPISTREQTFVPVRLEQMMRGAKAGERLLVEDEHVLVEGRNDVVLPPTPWFLTPMAVCCLVAAIVIGFSVSDIRRRRPSRWLDCVFYGILSLLGILLTFLIFISVHEATSPNLNYLWLNPLCLIGAIFPWWRSAERFIVWWQFINFALVLTLSTCALCGLQSINAAFWPLLLADAVRSLTDIYVYRRNATL